MYIMTIQEESGEVRHGSGQEPTTKESFFQDVRNMVEGWKKDYSRHLSGIEEADKALLREFWEELELMVQATLKRALDSGTIEQQDYVDSWSYACEQAFALELEMQKKKEEKFLMDTFGLPPEAGA